MRKGYVYVVHYITKHQMHLIRYPSTLGFIHVRSFSMDRKLENSVQALGNIKPLVVYFFFLFSGCHDEFP